MVSLLLFQSGALSGADFAGEDRMVAPVPGLTVKGSGGLEVYVKTWAGAAFAVDLPPDATIADMKQMIEQAEGTPAGIQRLSYQGELLRENLMSLADLGICPESVVCLEPAAEDGVCDIDVTFPPACSASCSSCRTIHASAGVYRRARPDGAKRELDVFYQIPPEMGRDPPPCLQIATHVRQSSQWKCSLGSSCWYRKCMEGGRRPNHIIRKVKKGVTLKGGLSMPEDWEFHWGTLKVAQSTLISQWAKGGAGRASQSDARHARSSGVYPNMQIKRSDLEEAAALKHQLFKVDEDVSATYRDKYL